MAKESKSRIGNLIREARLKSGLKQKELAEKVGVSESRISQYEGGTQNPRIETIEKIAAALDVSPGNLLGFEYWDMKYPNLAAEVSQYEKFTDYLESLGYSITVQQEDDERASFDIAGNSIRATLSENEFQRLQDSSSDLIQAFLWRKSKH